MTKQFISKASEDTQDLANRMGQKITQEIAIALTGDLGSGKTTFVQGLAQGLGVSDKYYVTSPTFGILNTYPAAPFTLCHLDLYRLESSDELEYIGFDDLLDNNNIIVVEWPKILEDISFAFDIEITFTFDAQYNRIISIVPYGQAGANLLSKLTL